MAVPNYRAGTSLDSPWNFDWSKQYESLLLDLDELEIGPSYQHLINQLTTALQDQTEDTQHAEARQRDRIGWGDVDYGRASATLGENQELDTEKAVAGYHARNALHSGIADKGLNLLATRQGRARDTLKDTHQRDRLENTWTLNDLGRTHQRAVRDTNTGLKEYGRRKTRDLSNIAHRRLTIW